MKSPESIRFLDAVEDMLSSQKRQKIDPKGTNRWFASNPSPVFAKACELAGVPITKRQASKWRRKTGRAYQFKDQAKRVLAKGAHDGKSA